MNRRLLPLFFTLTIFITSCGGEDSASNANVCTTGSSPYLGCWITIGCQSVTSQAGSGDVWGTVRYNFASDGVLYDQGKIYSNSSCVGTPVYEWGGHTDFEFTELGSEVLPSSLTAYRLNVVDVVDTGSTEVLLAVTDANQLCLSDSLQLSSADFWTFIFDQTPTDVDFTNCLDAY